MPRSISNRPRKSPRQSRSRSTVDAVLEAAARILESSSAAHASTNRIAELAGVSIGSLYQYFPSRDAIFAEMIRRDRLRMLARLEAAARAGDAEVAIADLVAAAVDQQLDRPGVARNLDRLEPELRMDEETRALEGRIGAMLDTWLRRICAAEPPPGLGQDLIAIAKGMIDAAGAAGEEAKAPLQARVGAALRGYLRERGVALAAPTERMP